VPPNLLSAVLEWALPVTGNAGKARMPAIQQSPNAIKMVIAKTPES
jgi:hypothetical protein